MNAKSDNVEITTGSETDEIIKKPFKSLLQRYQEGLQESMKGSEFVFDGVNAFYYDVNKINLGRGKSYIYSPKWLQNKKATINPKNNDDKCFQYALTVALNHEKIKKDPQRISEIEPFIDQYDWKEIDLKRIGKSFNQIINQLLLIFCTCLIILKK